MKSGNAAAHSRLPDGLGTTSQAVAVRKLSEED